MIKALTALFLIANITAGQSSNTPSAPAPVVSQVTLLPNELDLGVVIPGQHISRIVSIRNRSAKQPFDIRFVRASSPRVDGQISSTHLPPAGKAKVRVEFRSEVWNEGPFAEQVLLYPSDPNEPLVKVKVRGTLLAPIEWTPKILGVNYRLHDPQPLPKLRITSKDGNPIGPIHIKSFVPFLDAQATEEPSGSFTVELTLDPSVPIGPLLGWLRIETNHRKMPILDIPFGGQVIGRVLTRPLDFGLVQEGQPATAESSLLITSGEIHIIKTEPFVPTAADVSLNQKDKNYQIKVVLRSPPGLQDLKGYINLYTDSPAEPVIQVPVEGIVCAKRPFDDLANKGKDEQLFALIRAALLEGDNNLSDEDFLAKVLGSVRDERAVALLLRAMEDKIWAVRRRAVKIVGLLRSQAALEPIRNAVTHDIDEEVRRAAATALFQIAGEKSLPDLLLAVQDSDDWVREDAERLLGELGDSRAVPLLTRGLSDDVADVRTAAKEALEKIENKSKADQPRRHE